ncbi:MAG: endonuclease/exonuclease/phosphatase family protein [Microlunatus sp.]
MRCRRLVALSVGPLLAVGLVSVPPVAEAASATPSTVTSVTASPGSSPGTAVFTWQSEGKNTDYFLLETGLTAFSKSSSSSLPRSGRHAATFKISASSRSWTMSKADAATAGSPLGSANYLYYRFTAVNVDGSKTHTKAFPTLQTVMPRGLAASANGKGTDMRVATFNVRTVKKTKDKRNWLKRVDDVAAEILTTRAGVVLVQEASPGRADGKSGSTAKVGRQTTTLVSHLAKQGGSKYDYRMVRTTSYLKSGLPRGTQGGRVLYDNKRYKLLSSCPEKTGKKSYNASCSFKLPILSTDSEKKRRRGGYALLENRSSGQRFWAVAAHLDERHSTSKTTGPKYDQLRATQARSILTLISSLNTKGYPVILGADINTWQSDKSGYSGHDVLVAGGFYDTLAADVKINPQFTTSNGFKTTLTPNGNGVGSHLDVVMVKGGRGGADRWVNVMQNPDANRPSDHNLVYADITI